MNNYSFVKNIEKCKYFINRLLPKNKKHSILCIKVIEFSILWFYVN